VHVVTKFQIAFTVCKGTVMQDSLIYEYVNNIGCSSDAISPLYPQVYHKSY